MTEAINAYVQFFFKQYSESEIIATILDANTIMESSREIWFQLNRKENVQRY